jgi:hypothetical protein
MRFGPGHQTKDQQTTFTEAVQCLRRMSRREEVDFGIAHACSRCRSLRRTEDSSIPKVGDYLFIEIVPGLGRAVEEEELSFPPFSSRRSCAIARCSRSPRQMQPTS